MTYLDEAYRRFKLPIYVSYGNISSSSREMNSFVVYSGPGFVKLTPDAEQAKAAYLAAVKELSQ